MWSDLNETENDWKTTSVLRNPLYASVKPWAEQPPFQWKVVHLRLTCAYCTCASTIIKDKMIHQLKQSTRYCHCLQMHHLPASVTFSGYSMNISLCCFTVFQPHAFHQLWKRTVPWYFLWRMHNNNFLQWCYNTQTNYIFGVEKLYGKT